IDGTGITRGAKDSNMGQAMEDARQELEVSWSDDENDVITDALLLTGVTGFLGIHVLDALLAETAADIYCLIRSKGEPEQRFDEVLAFYGKEHLRGNPRIKILKADLEEPKLGLKPGMLDWLQENLNGIWHCGALVHHLYDYGRLRRANVQATIELLKLAATGRKKSFNYISTLGTASIRDQEGRTVEVDVSARPISTNGYTLSKWVCEQILTRVAAQGMQVNIFRPGNITSESVTGICKPEVNHTLLRIKGCLQMKAAPDWKRTTEMVPVDLLARAMLKLSNTSQEVNIYNMNNPYEIPWGEYVALFRNSGFRLELVPEPLWREEYLSNIGETNALYAIRGFYNRQDKEPAHRDIKPFFRWNSLETAHRLQDLGIFYLNDYHGYMKTVITWLVGSGFLADLQEQEEI
ncbi:MAG: thioester reductase domain-containing protein, partial [Deltaproteobacteria bacterium]|nr:thioester reductase domain-containing protein [Deltaproteobacteria bacterium]